MIKREMVGPNLAKGYSATDKINPEIERMLAILSHFFKVNIPYTGDHVSASDPPPDIGLNRICVRFTIAP
jgi:hypothetical protein